MKNLAGDGAGFGHVRFIPGAVPGIFLCFPVCSFFIDSVVQNPESGSGDEESLPPSQTRKPRPREIRDVPKGAAPSPLGQEAQGAGIRDPSDFEAGAGSR